MTSSSPTGASSLTSNNDLTAGTTFGSLTIADTGYSITGNAASFTSIDASQTSGSSEVDLPIALAAAVAVDHAGAKLVLGGVISGSAGLTKNGPGVLDLTAANTYTGTTAITAGVLQVDGAQGGSPVSVASTATLGGTRDGRHDHGQWRNGQSGRLGGRRPDRHRFV